jgi:RNA polymerase-binding transcription factor DksA
MAEILETVKHVDGTYVVCLDCDVPIEFALAFLRTESARRLK